MALRTQAVGTQFQPLTATDFEAIEKLGKVSFPEAARSSLNVALERLCGVHGDNLVAAEHKEAARLLKTLHRRLADAAAMLTAIDTADASGARLAKWQLFPADRIALFGDNQLSGEALLQWQDSARHLTTVKELTKLAEHGAEKLTPKRSKGAPCQLWLNSFIVIVADAYTAAGGTPSAAWQEIRGQRETPFLRALRAIHAHMPADRRAVSDTALDERARLVLAGRRTDKG